MCKQPELCTRKWCWLVIMLTQFNRQLTMKMSKQLTRQVGHIRSHFCLGWKRSFVTLNMSLTHCWINIWEFKLLTFIFLLFTCREKKSKSNIFKNNPILLKKDSAFFHKNKQEKKDRGEKKCQQIWHFFTLLTSMAEENKCQKCWHFIVSAIDLNIRGQVWTRVTMLPDASLVTFRLVPCPGLSQTFVTN